MSELLYQLENISFAYPLGKEKVQALSNVSVNIPKGSMLCLTGPSGSGKTTLLNLLGFLEAPQSGDLKFLDSSIKSLSESNKNKIRKFKLGFIFQSFHLFPTLRADENVEFFLARQKIPKKDRLAQVESALQAVGLWEHRKKRPNEMSGGQRQRVAIARAIAKRPEVLIADEPTASLDQKTGREILDILLKLNQDRKITVICSSHDPMVQSLIPNQLHLKDGKLT